MFAHMPKWVRSCKSVKRAGVGVEQVRHCWWQGAAGGQGLGDAVENLDAEVVVAGMTDVKSPQFRCRGPGPGHRDAGHTSTVLRIQNPVCIFGAVTLGLVKISRPRGLWLWAERDGMLMSKHRWVCAYMCISMHYAFLVHGRCATSAP